MRISDWSSDVCSSDLAFSAGTRSAQGRYLLRHAESPGRGQGSCVALRRAAGCRLAQQFQFKSSARACREPRYDPGLWSWMLRVVAPCYARDWRAAMTPRAAILPYSPQQMARWLERVDPSCAVAPPGP